MKRYRLTATLLEPLCLPIERQSQIPATLRYIPGGVLRGGIAGMHLRAGKSPSDPVFQTLFGDSAVHFPDLLPSRAPDEISQVFPLTAESCKRRPGFKDDGGHGVRDTLALRAVSAPSPEAPLGDRFRCDECDQDLKPLEGVWNGDVAKPGQRRVTVEVRLHTGIDRLSGTGAEGIFYGTEAVSPYFVMEGGPTPYGPQYFTGRIFLTPAQAEAMQSMIRDPLFIGADKSRGYGEVRLDMVEEGTPGVAEHTTWDSRFRALAESWGVTLPPAFYFSITLLSHMVTVDRFLRFSPDLPWMFPGVVPVCRSTRAITVRGWSTGYRLPKPDDLAMKSGSVFLYKYEGQDSDGLLGALAELERKGTGLRREEGLGQVAASWPFHVELGGTAQ